MNPFNLLLRFILELITLIVVGIWGYNLTNTNWKFVLAILFPTLLMSLWVIFAVPNDPSRSGKSVIPVSGIIRLVLEFVFFLFGGIATYNNGYLFSSLVFGLLVIVHYLFSFSRLIKLIKHTNKNPQF